MLTNLITLLIAVLILGGGGKYLFEFIRYLRSGQYEVDKRFWDVTQ